MTNASKDENSANTLIGISNSDGTTIVLPWANVSTHNLLLDDNTTGTDHGNHGGVAYRDENGIPVMIAVSETDGFTPIELYVDPVTHKLLVDSN